MDTQINNQSQPPLRVDHLQLSARAYNSCIDLGCDTIPKVIAGLESGRLAIKTLGRKTAGEVESAVRTLKEFTGSAGEVDWAKFWEVRPIVAYQIAISTPSLRALSPEIRDQSLGLLHLKKACSGLHVAGITTIGQLLDAAINGIRNLENFGRAAHAEVAAALPALSESILPDGMVDWCRYAQARGFTLIPETPNAGVNGGELLQLIPSICQAVIPEQMDDRAWEIFKRRLLAPGDQQETLENIGTVYGVTRERIRQIESISIQAIRRPLFADDYFGLRFRLRPELGRGFSNARKHFESLGQPAWQEVRWVNELATLWQVKAAAILRYDRLLTELFGYRRVCPEHRGLEPLILDDATPAAEARRLLALVDAMHDVLLVETSGLDAFGLALALKKRGLKLNGPDEVPVLVELCSSVERVGSELYRVRFEFVRNREEQAYRVLSDHGSPLHYSELLREINRHAKLPLESKENLVNQICGGDRLKSIGNTGQWALAEWGLESRSLVDVMEEVLKVADEALPTDEIAAQVLEKRPGSSFSVAMLLDQYPERFRKVGPKLYALSAWGVSSGEDNYWHNDAVAKFVEDFFAARKGQPVNFNELREAFSRASGLSARSAQGVLNSHPAVEVERPDWRRRIARLRKNWQSFERERRVRKGGPLQVDQIVELACKKLNAASTGELPLSTIVQQVETELGIKRPNIYAAISQSDEVETIAIEGSVFKICRLVGHTHLTFPHLANLVNVNWRSECERAIAKLTVENVDVGLFMLGRQFDQAMRQLLETARDHAGMTVTKDDIKSVGFRIVWAVRHKILHDEVTLNLLKSERNARGHEPAPLAERQALMKFAPYLASLYLDYLLIIEQKMGVFRAKKSAVTGVKPS